MSLIKKTDEHGNVISITITNDDDIDQESDIMILDNESYQDMLDEIKSLRKYNEEIKDELKKTKREIQNKELHISLLQNQIEKIYSRNILERIINKREKTYKQQLK